MEYLRRALDDLLDKVFPGVPAITIEGAKAIGRTETVRCRVQRVLELDGPHTLSALRADTDTLLGIDKAVLIDGWRHYPPMWDHVRRAVDRRRDLTALLVGSATPRPGTASRPDAERIASLVMRPVSLTERGVAPGEINVAELLEREATIEGYSPLRLPDCTEGICVSGLPGLCDIRPVVLSLQFDSYLARIVDRDLPEEGVLIQRPQTSMTWLTAYAVATSAPASCTAILGAATAGETDKPNRAITQTYRDLLARIWVLDPIPSRTTSLASLARPKTKPKHQLLDPALAAHPLDVAPAKLLSGAPGSGETPGQLFETLVTLCMRARATATGLQISHLRTRNGDHKINLIVKNTAGKVAAIEVELTHDPDDADVRHLHWLGDRVGGRLVDKVVATIDEYAYHRDDGVAVIPLGLLS